MDALVTAAVGFLGVIVGGVMNYLIQRRDRADRERSEALAYVSTLKEELSLAQRLASLRTGLDVVVWYPVTHEERMLASLRFLPPDLHRDVLSLFAQATLSNHLMEMIKMAYGQDARTDYEMVYEQEAADFDRRLPDVLNRLEEWLAGRK